MPVRKADTKMERIDGNFSFFPRQNLAEETRTFLKIMTETLRSGRSPLLPLPDGSVDNYPAVDIVTDREIRGMSGILLSSVKCREEFIQNFWIGAAFARRLGLHPVGAPVTVLSRKEEAVVSKKYLNISQFEETEPEILEATSSIRARSKLERLAEKGITPRVPPDSKVSNHGHFGHTRLGRKPVRIMTPDVKEYLRLYLKSVDEKVPLHVDAEVAEQFRLNALQALRQKKTSCRRLPSGVVLESNVNRFKYFLLCAMHERVAERVRGRKPMEEKKLFKGREGRIPALRDKASFLRQGDF